MKKYLRILGTIALLIQLTSCGASATYRQYRFVKDKAFMRAMDFSKDFKRNTIRRKVMRIATNVERPGKIVQPSRTYFVHAGASIYKLTGKFESNFHSSKKGRAYDFAKHKFSKHSTIENWFKGVVDFEDTLSLQVYNESLTTQEGALKKHNWLCKLNNLSDIPLCLQTHFFVENIDRELDTIIIRENFVYEAHCFQYYDKKKRIGGLVTLGLSAGSALGFIAIYASQVGI